MAARKFYIRFGALPAGRSEVGADYRAYVRRATGVTIPRFEAGVSVFATSWSPLLHRWVIFAEHGTAASLSELWDAAARGKRAILLVTGRRDGDGADGEPVLRRSSIQVERKLSLAEIFFQDQGIEQLSDQEVRDLLAAPDRATYLAATKIEKAALRRIKRARAADQDISPELRAEYDQAAQVVLMLYRTVNVRVAQALRALGS